MMELHSARYSLGKVARELKLPISLLHFSELYLSVVTSLLFSFLLHYIGTRVIEVVEHFFTPDAEIYFKVTPKIKSGLLTYSRNIIKGDVKWHSGVLIL